jgi:plasmid stabilization system protein ParE
VSRYKLTDDALADLEEIADYIGNDDVDAAIRVVRDIRAAMARLADMPRIGHMRRDLADEEIRFWPAHSYLILYRPMTEPLEIIRIVSGFRDVAGMMDET